MPDRSSKRPRDPNQLAKMVVDIAMGELTEPVALDARNAAAVTLGRLGGLKGGAARAARLSADERKQIAKRAAEARWKKSGE